MPEPRDCQTCHKAFTPRQERGDKFCSRPCYHASIGPRKEAVKYRMRTAKNHPLAPPSGQLAVARINLYDSIGAGPHRCNWCNALIEWNGRDGIVADHLNFDTTDDSPGNLVPSCNACNSHRRKRGDSPIIKEEELWMNWSGSRTRAVQRYCVWCATPFLTIPAEVRKGKGLYCSRSCARRRA